VVVRLDGGESELTLEVVDDGVGFDPAEPELRSRHLGLTSMEERAREMGGTLQLSSAPGQGTTVRLQVPRDDR
jgi:signal transduction histidine kinase